MSAFYCTPWIFGYVMIAAKVVTAKKEINKLAGYDKNNTTCNNINKAANTQRSQSLDFSSTQLQIFVAS